jgi:hypothetical protein
METVPIATGSVTRARLITQVVGLVVCLALACAAVATGVVSSKMDVKVIALFVGTLFLGVCGFGLWKTAARLRHGCSIAVFQDRIVIADCGRVNDLILEQIEELVVVRHSSFINYRLRLKDGRIINCPEVPNLKEVLLAIRGVVHPTSA